MMKRKPVSFLLSLFLVLSLSGGAHALVMGTGEFELFFPDDADNISIPDYQYGSIRQFGSISEYPGSSFYFGLETETDETYEGYGSYNDSEIAGIHNRSTGSQTYSFSAVSPDPGNVTATARIDFYSRAGFSGVLQDFGYRVFFTGHKDDPANSMYFSTQMEISYYEDEEGARRYVYSDYGTYGLVTDPAENFRTNWAFFPNVESGEYSGEFTFDYSDYGERNWLITWDFMGSGIDKSGLPTPDPIPEPATMLLVGTGLAGLGVLRRRFRG